LASMKKTIRVSDIDGTEIDDTSGARISIVFADQRRGRYELDVTGDEQEVRSLLERGRKVARRGRRPATA
jgi:hypothetical protein